MGRPRTVRPQLRRDSLGSSARPQGVSSASRQLPSLESLMIPKHLLLAKAVLLIALGLGLGYALGVSYAKDAIKARTITMEEYVADFERYKADLASSSDIPMPAAVVTGLIMVVGALGLYELLAMALAKGLAAVVTPDSATPFPNG